MAEDDGNNENGDEEGTNPEEDGSGGGDDGAGAFQMIDMPIEDELRDSYLTYAMTAAVYDGSAMRLYQDGVEVGSTAKSGPIAAPRNSCSPPTLDAPKPAP